MRWPPPPALSVALQNSPLCGSNPVNGCPGGNGGPLVADRSHTLAISLMVGNRQPPRPPMFRPMHLPVAKNHLSAPFGDRDHTKPVSRSRTASLLKLESTMNRVLDGSV